ncbi:protein kinase domain-containing protein [Sarocladium implicatum]|nr:protein kinase domain-containing protein [Sarocladium implicatum]
MPKAKLQFTLPQRYRGPHSANRQIKRSKTVAFLLLVAALLHFTVISRSNRNALSAKYSPTIYNTLSAQQNEDLAGDHWRWDSKNTPTTLRSGYSRKRLLDSRDEWKSLGSGFEGETFTYDGVVIKAYRSANAPFRNCVPGLGLNLRWPTEISASLVLGGLAEETAISEDDYFVSVVDYFLAPVDDDEHLKWHFVTPFLSAGHLNNLAKRLRHSDQRYTAQELDVLFRASFEHVLAALETMHTSYDLCHDDIKPDNIFLATDSDGTTRANETTHWLLADMGNVRQVNHPYHRSIIWTRSNLPDCRANDAFRLVKSYMKFLSRASRDSAEFNEQFLAGETAWSRLFWATWRDVQEKVPVSAARLQARSLSLDFIPGSHSRPSSLGSWPAELRDPVYWSLLGREKMLAREVKSKLFIGATEIPARLWGMSPVLGIPVPECQT